MSFNLIYIFREGEREGRIERERQKERQKKKRDRERQRKRKREKERGRKRDRERERDRGTEGERAMYLFLRNIYTKLKWSRPFYKYTCYIKMDKVFWT